MTAVEQLVLALQSLARAALMLARPAMLIPWGIVLVLRLAPIVLVWGFAHPTVSPILMPLLARWGGEEALHYPYALQRIPALVDLVQRAIEAVLAPLAAAATAWTAVRLVQNSPVRPADPLSAVRPRAGETILALLPYHLVAGAAVVTLVTGTQEPNDWIPLQIAQLAVVAIAGMAATAIAYLIPRMVEEQVPAPRALRELPALLQRAPWAALALGAVAAAGTATGVGPQFAPPAIDPPVPEHVAWTAIATTAFATLAQALFYGGAALVHWSMVAEETWETPWA